MEIMMKIEVHHQMQTRSDIKKKITKIENHQKFIL